MEQREVSEKSYLPFGVAIGESGSGYGYLGEAYDAVTKTINLRARQYEPELQRFSQRDALVGDPTKPLTLNRYLYVANDSVNYEDPSGLALSSLMKKVATTVKTTAKQVVKKAAMVQTASKVFSVVAGGVVERVTGSKTVQVSVKNAISSTVVAISPNTPLPGTPLYNFPDQYGIKIKSKNWDDYSLTNAIIDTKNLTSDEIRKYYVEITEFSEVMEGKSSD